MEALGFLQLHTKSQQLAPPLTTSVLAKSQVTDEPQVTIISRNGKWHTCGGGRTNLVFQQD